MLHQLHNYKKLNIIVLLQTHNNYLRTLKGTHVPQTIWLKIEYHAWHLVVTTTIHGKWCTELKIGSLIY